MNDQEKIEQITQQTNVISQWSKGLLAGLGLENSL